MKSNAYLPPSPRAPVADPQLWRPDWTVGGRRDPCLLWLDKNENTDPELATITSRVLAEVGAQTVATYPDSAPLYRKLGMSLDLGADHLVLTAGSDGAIRAVFEAYIAPGDAVVHTLPTFAMYAVYCQMYGAHTMQLAYQPSTLGPLLSAETVIDAIHAAKPKLVCLPNPDSPTGTVFEPEALRRIIEAAGKSGALILIDEAYYPFYNQTVVPWVDDYPHLVVARTFAKAWGLAGLRIGCAVAAPEVAQILHKVRPMYEVNTMAVAMMERMLDFQGEMLASVRRLNAGKAAFLAAMEELDLRVLRGQGNFLHVAFGSRAPAVHAALADLVLYRQDFKESCLKGFSRFSSTTPDRFQPVIERIHQTVLSAK